ncbi:MAG TPA: 5-oxoprolinase subunit PxpB [Pseudosphingobacterium sp.]|nr:5-oxoprolinase subunit PxpB [Pseudosphingobacterium sp.]
MSQIEIKKKSSDASNFNIYSLSEYAITLAYNAEINNSIFDQISYLNEAIYRHPFEGFQCAVPAYVSITIFFDPILVIKSNKLIGLNCFERISNYLFQLTKNFNTNQLIKKPPIVIPICYEDEYAPDIEELANLLALEKENLIQLHSKAQYKVHMIGFVPGFPYLGGMSERLSIPRKNNPIKKVPAGSVGIAGKQTGIYPFETPGGWYLIGRTPVVLFDTKRSQPALLQAGDEVIFDPISKQDFERIRSEKNAVKDH